MLSFFDLEGSKTTIKTEFLAGLTTFVTISYILTVTPNILGDAGMNQGAVFTATALISIIGTLLMAFLAKLPLVVTTGMGLNAYVAYSIVIGKGYTWQEALGIVFVTGIIFFIISSSKLRENIFNAIPSNLKSSISVGIGFFITLIGFINAELVVAGDGTLLTLGDLTTGPPLVAVFGIILTAYLLHKNIPGGILLGIMGSTVFAILLGVAHLPTQVFALPPSIEPVMFQLSFGHLLNTEVLVIIITMLFINMFDAVGSIVGIGRNAGLIDENGNVENSGKALQAVASGTTIAGLLGASPAACAVEAASGIAQGGRTGLTSIFTAVFFALSLFLYPIFSIIPSAATAPALIVVGLLMVGNIKDVDFSDWTEGIPAFLTIVTMPFAYSTADGIVIGFISYVIMKVITGRWKEVSPFMYVFAILFILTIIL